MKLSFRLYSLGYPLRSLLVKCLRFQKRPIQATIPGLMPPPKPWYLVLILETLKTMLFVIAGFALAIFFVAIMHYTGNDYLFNPKQKI